MCAIGSAVCLFGLTLFHWYGVELINTSNLLFAIQSVEPGRNAWQALEFVPVFVAVTVVATVVCEGLLLVGLFRRFGLVINALVVILGLASFLLILFRIVDPPTFRTEATITAVGVVQAPMFVALVAAAGVMVGGLVALREEGGGFGGLFRRRMTRIS